MNKYLLIFALLASPCYAQTAAVARWQLNEPTGTAALVDSTNGHNLTPSGIIDTASGLFKGGKDFEAGNTRYADVADTSNLSAGNVVFGGTCWFKPETTSGTAVIAMKGWQTAADVNREWVLYMSSSTAVRFTLEKADGSGVVDLTNSNVSMAAGNWYFIAWWYDPVTDLMNLKVNGSPTQTAACTTGTYDGTRAFVLGGSPGQALYADGVIDDFRWYKTNYPTEAELQDLYYSSSSPQYTEFYCNHATGSNMNGGSEEATSASYSSTNGNWDSTTGVFTPTSGDPSASVTVGEYASVFNDGATTPVFIGRVMAVNATTVTISTTIKSGTAPTTSATARSINVGGVWKGPNGANGFPFNLIQTTMRDDDVSTPRVNLKNNATYDITAAMTSSTYGGPVTFQGYTTTPGDGGEAKIDGGNSGTRYVLYTLTNGNGSQHQNLWFTRNGATGTVQSLTSVPAGAYFTRCRFSHSSAFGTSGGNYFECEAYSNGSVGFNGPASATRCIAHSNTTIGFDCTNTSAYVLDGCISHNNTTVGYYLRATAARFMTVRNCDAYENGSHGFWWQKEAQHHLIMENCNSIKNTGMGFFQNQPASPQTTCLTLRKCGFGQGSFANTAGAYWPASGVITENTSFFYPANVSPWVDPDNADFRIKEAAAIGKGTGSFLQLSGLFSGSTIGYPHIGAAPRAPAVANPFGGGPIQ